MTKLLLMLKRAAAAYPRLKRSTGYPSFQQTRGYAAASTSARRAVGSLSPPAGGLAGRRLFCGDHKFSHEGSQDSKGEKDKDAAKFIMKSVRMTKKFYPTTVLAFALICLLLALKQRQEHLESISKNMDELMQKMDQVITDLRAALGSDDE